MVRLVWRRVLPLSKARLRWRVPSTRRALGVGRARAVVRIVTGAFVRGPILAHFCGQDIGPTSRTFGVSPIAVLVPWLIWILQEKSRLEHFVAFLARRRGCQTGIHCFHVSVLLQLCEAKFTLCSSLSF